VPGGGWLLAAVAATLVVKLAAVPWLLGLDQWGWPYLVNAGAVLAMAAWAACVRPALQVPLFLLLSTVVTAVAYADVLYFRQFGDLLSVATLRLAGEGASVATAAAALARPRDAWLWIDVPLGVAAWMYARRRGLRWRALPLRAGAPLAVAGALVVGTDVAVDPALDRLYHGHTMMVRRAGLLAYHAMDAAAWVAREARRMEAPEEALAEVRAWFAARPADPPAPTFGLAAGRNLIVLQVESLQAFAMGLSIDGRPVTPNLDRLAGESLHYTNFYTEIGQGVTADADLLVNCSLYPTATGAVYYSYADDDYRCLPTLLRESGYRSVAMQGIRPDFWNYAAMYPRVGFEAFHSIDDYDRSDEIFLGVSDASFLRQSIAKLHALPEPFHAFLVTLTSHTPFEHEGLPKTFDAGRYEGTDVGRYLNALHYTDAAIGAFVEQIRADGLLDRSVLVVYGDHMALWHDATGLRDLFADVPVEDEPGWWRIIHRVPLLVRLPGGALAGERDEAAGEVDVAPTLAGLLGLRFDRAFLMGRDLLARPRGGVVFPDGSALDDAHLYVADGEASRCWRFADDERDDASACAPLAATAERALRTSRAMVERNLIGRLAGQTPPATAENIAPPGPRR
jgi:phosphoglycerol transferase MdoB-like AlkP superfamily enzyme